MAKSMNQIRLFRRDYFRTPCRNPTVPGQDTIVEVRFQPHYTETGAKMVTVTRICYEEQVESVRTETGEWEQKTSWTHTVTRQEEMTPDEANKVWSYGRKKCTTKVPAEIE